jgi:uncharacterized protein DUF4139/uncharacterized protein DUF4140
MNRIFIGILMSLALLSTAKSNEVHVNCKPQEIIVYKLGAHIEFEFQAKFKKGMNKIVIDSLPLAFDPSSFVLSSNKKILINSLEYEFDKFDDKKIVYTRDIIKKQDSIKRLNVQIAKLNYRKEILKGEEKIVTEYSVDTKSNSNASVQELKEHAAYYYAKVTEIKDLMLDVEFAIEQAEETINLYEKEIEKFKEKFNRDNFKMIAMIKSDKSETKNIVFSCLTQNAGWIPSYDIRVLETNAPFELTFNAKIWQVTGYDWKDAKITISTRNPSVYSVYEELKPWRVWNGYKSDIYQGGSQGYDYRYIGGSAIFSKYLDDNDIKLRDMNPVPVYEKKYYSSRSSGIFSGGGGMNSPCAPASSGSSGGRSSSDRNREEDAKKKKNTITLLTSGDQMVGVGAENYFSFAYSPNEKYDISSGKKPMHILLDEEKVECDYQHIAQPKVASEAFLIAKISDWGKLRLLNGEANVYMENTYIGKSKINVVNAKDTMLISIGRVRGVITERTKIKEYTENKFFSSNIKRMIGYKINIINNKDVAVSVKLQEQIPVSTSDDIEIELLQWSNASVNQETGVLEWEVELAAGESKEVVYVYEVDMPYDTMIY